MPISVGERKALPPYNKTSRPPEVIKVAGDSSRSSTGGAIAHCIRLNGFAIVQGMGKAVEPIMLRALLKAQEYLKSTGDETFYVYVEMPEVEFSPDNFPGELRTVIRYTLMTFTYMTEHGGIRPTVVNGQIIKN